MCKILYNVEQIIPANMPFSFVFYSAAFSFNLLKDIYKYVQIKYNNNNNNYNYYNYYYILILVLLLLIITIML